MDIHNLHEQFLQSKGVNTDTRNLQKDQLFFALTGDNFNGNTYAELAINKGARLAIIDQEKYKVSDNCLIVDNVLKTLQELAAYHRKYLGLPILAITGSNGKTTSKELIHAVLRKKFNTVATVGNLNNHIGVPLTLLSMKKSTEFGIVEMGANHHKEIEMLCNIATPDYGYITNFGKAHLEGFGSLEGVIKAKSELYDHLKNNDKLIFLNIDDPIQVKQLSYDSSYSFGEIDKADIKVSYDKTQPKATLIFEGSNKITSQLTGHYNAINMAAAITIGKYFKVSTECIKTAIEAYTPKNNRSQIVKLNSITLLMDAYNANPTSMRAALESFKASEAKTKIVILGDMFELGTTSKTEHQEIADLIKEMQFDKAYLTGSNFYETKTEGERVEKYKSFEDLAASIRMEDLKESQILIKGSRGMALERLVDIFKKQVQQ
jgi:UDP-N-acetylmuramoyl-tripeptide--D-alanyl-D-alanine ligase